MKNSKLFLTSNLNNLDLPDIESFDKYSNLQQIVSDFPQYNVCVLINQICSKIAGNKEKIQHQTPVKPTLPITPATNILIDQDQTQALPEIVCLEKSFEIDLQQTEHSGAKLTIQPIQEFSNHSFLSNSEPVQKQTIITKQQICKAREICGYLSSLSKSKVVEKSQILMILDSLRIVSDFTQIQGGKSVQDLTSQVLFYFESILGIQIEQQSPFSAEQLYAACNDYVQLGKVGVHYMHQVLLQ